MTKLKDNIEALIQAAEQRHNKKLTIEDFDFLTANLIEFVTLASNKFVHGAATHGDDFLTDVDHLHEIKPELIDAWMYAAGGRRKQFLFDERYNLNKKIK